MMYSKPNQPSFYELESCVCCSTFSLSSQELKLTDVICGGAGGRGETQ